VEQSNLGTTIISLGLEKGHQNRGITPGMGIKKRRWGHLRSIIEDGIAHERKNEKGGREGKPATWKKETNG